MRQMTMLMAHPLSRRRLEQLYPLSVAVGLRLTLQELSGGPGFWRPVRMAFLSYALQQVILAYVQRVFSTGTAGRRGCCQRGCILLPPV